MRKETFNESEEGTRSRYVQKGVGLLGKIVLGLMVIAVVIIVGAILSSIRTIDAGYVGVVFDMQNGVIEPIPLDQGWKIVRPWGITVIPMETRIQKETQKLSAGTKDLQTATTEIALNYRIRNENAPWIYQNIGLDYNARIIDPQIKEQVKAATAKFAADQLLPEREQVKQLIFEYLSESLGKSRIEVIDISITDFAFSPEFQSTIEEKQVSLQRTLKAKNDLERIKVEAEQTVATAEAQAKAIKIKGEAIRSSPELVQLEWVYKWDGIVPQYYFGSGTSTPSMLINIPTPQK